MYEIFLLDNYTMAKTGLDGEPEYKMASLELINCLYWQELPLRGHSDMDHLDKFVSRMLQHGKVFKYH